MSQIGLNTQQQANLIANGPQAQGSDPRPDLPQALQNARPANAPQPRGGFSLMNVFRAIGQALGIARPAAQPPQPRVVPQPPQPAPQTSPQKQLADLVYSSGELPADVKQMGKEIIDELREMFGKEVIPSDKTFTSLADTFDLAHDIRKLQGQDFKTALPGLIRKHCLKGAQKAAVSAYVETFCKEQGLNLGGTQISKVKTQLLKNKQTMEQVAAAKNMLDIAAALGGPLTSQHLQDMRRTSEINTCSDCNQVQQWAVELMQERTGYSAEMLRENVNFHDIISKSNQLAMDLQKGKVGTEPGFNIAQAFRDVVKDFVDKRMARVQEVDTLDISPELKQRWKTEMLQFGMPKGVKLGDLVTAGKCGWGSILKGQLESGRPVERLAMDLNETAKVLDKRLNDIYGSRFMVDLGREGRSVIMRMAAQVMMEATPGLSEAFGARHDLLDMIDTLDLETEAQEDILSEGFATPANDNADWGDILKKPGLTKLPAHVYQGIWDGTGALRTAFGQDALPASMKDVLNMNLPGGQTVRQAVSARMAAVKDHRLATQDVAAIMKEVLTPALRQNAFTDIMRSTGEQYGLALSPEDMERAIDQLRAENPQLDAAESRDALMQQLAATPHAADMLVAAHQARTQWEAVRSELAIQISKKYGLTEARTQELMSRQPDLFDEFRALSAEKRSGLMEGDKFAGWCQERIDARAAAIDEAMGAIREAGLPDAAKNSLINEVIAGGGDAQLIAMAVRYAGPAAGGLDATGLENALRGGKVKTNALLTALNGFERQLQNALPSKGFNAEGRALLESATRQIFLQKHGELADLMARLPAEQVKELCAVKPAPAGLALLHEARGMAAENWLQPAEADAIRTGAAGPDLQRHLENALHHGEAMLAQFVPVLSDETLSFLRHFIGTLDLDTEAARYKAEVQMARMGAAMRGWESFSAGQAPEALNNYLKTSLQEMAAGDTLRDSMNTDNIHNNFYKDVPRSLYTIKGTSRRHGNPDEVVKDFKDTLTPNHAQPGLSEAEKAHNAKVQRFVSALMMQGFWSKIFTAALGENPMGGLVHRPDPNGAYLLAVLGAGRDLLHVELEMSEDGKTAIVRQTNTIDLPQGLKDSGNAQNAAIGYVRFSHEVTVSLEGEPQITGCRVSQKLIGSLREIV